MLINGVTHFCYLLTGGIKQKAVTDCSLKADFNVFLDFSETGKHDKRHTEHGNDKPRTRLSGKEACVLLTADERTTGTPYALLQCLPFFYISILILLLFSITASSHL